MADLDPGDLGTTPPRTALGSTAPPAGAEADLAKFEQFYRAEIAALVAFLLYLGGSLADAADAAQAAMIEAFRVWPTIRTPQAWVRTVASRTLLRHLATVRETPTDGEGLEPSPLLPKPTPITEWEQRHEVVRLIQMLPPRQRQVMAWTFDGYTPTQIADILDLDPDTVRQNLRKARAALAAHHTATREEDTRDA